jgi:hypothetical protein
MNTNWEGKGRESEVCRGDSWAVVILKLICGHVVLWSPNGEQSLSLLLLLLELQLDPPAAHRCSNAFLNDTVIIRWSLPECH